MIEGEGLQEGHRRRVDRQYIIHVNHHHHDNPHYHPADHLHPIDAEEIRVRAGDQVPDDETTVRIGIPRYVGTLVHAGETIARGEVRVQYQNDEMPLQGEETPHHDEGTFSHGAQGHHGGDQGLQSVVHGHPSAVLCHLGARDHPVAAATLPFHAAVYHHDPWAVEPTGSTVDYRADAATRQVTSLEGVLAAAVMTTDAASREVGAGVDHLIVDGGEAEVQILQVLAEATVGDIVVVGVDQREDHRDEHLKNHLCDQQTKVETLPIPNLDSPVIITLLYLELRFRLDVLKRLTSSSTFHGSPRPKFSMIETAGMSHFRRKTLPGVQVLC